MQTQLEKELRKARQNFDTVKIKQLKQKLGYTTTNNKPINGCIVLSTD